MPAAEVTAVRSLLDRTARDPAQGPTARLRALRTLRADLNTLLGQADSYLSDGELRMQAGGMSAATQHLRARENADARDKALAEGIATPADLDRMGFVSHDQLDAMEADGTLAPALEEGLVAWADRFHPPGVTTLEEADAKWDYATTEERAALRARAGAKADGVTLRKDKAGYFVHTHRARSKSYGSVDAIPQSVVDFIESTG